MFQCRYAVWNNCLFLFNCELLYAVSKITEHVRKLLNLSLKICIQWSSVKFSDKFSDKFCDKFSESLVKHKQFKLLIFWSSVVARLKLFRNSLSIYRSGRIGDLPGLYSVLKFIGKKVDHIRLQNSCQDHLGMESTW